MAKTTGESKNSLTMYQASTCETAREPVCKCRCGGALHGARRGGELSGGAVDTSFFEGLPEDDAHHVTPEVVRKTRSREQRVSRSALKTTAKNSAAAAHARERFNSLLVVLQRRTLQRGCPTEALEDGALEDGAQEAVLQEGQNTHAH